MKKKIIVAVLLCLTVLGSVFAFAGCATKELVGFDIELAKLVAEELNITVRFQEIEWTNKEMELQSKNIDLVWNGLTIDEERLQKMQISIPYMNNNQVAVIRKTDKDKYTNSIDSIKDANFAFEGGSAGESVAKKYAFAKTNDLLKQIDAVTEVKMGTSDIALVDSVLANYYCNSDTAFKNLMVIPDFILNEEQYGIAARKGDVGTIDKINTVLSQLQANGKFKQLAEKYGLASEICDVTYESKWDSFTDDEKAGWKYIQDKGEIVIGYTIYAPIAFKG